MTERLHPVESMVLTIAQKHVMDGDSDIGPNMLAMLVATIERLSAEATPEVTP